jgi:hypothetical protein
MSGTAHRRRFGAAARGSYPRSMLLGTIWELAIPALVALVTVVLWLVQPPLRQNSPLRPVLITSVVVTAVDLMLGTLVFGVFFLSGGMENF